jgi:regulator of replication initiation timing
MTSQEIQRANDMLEAIRAQREAALNANVQMQAEMAALRRRIAELDAEIAAKDKTIADRDQTIARISCMPAASNHESGASPGQPLPNMPSAPGCGFMDPVPAI